MERPFTFLSEFAHDRDNIGLVRGFKDYGPIVHVRRFAVTPKGDVYVTDWTDDRDNFDAPGRVWHRVSSEHPDYNREFEFTGWYPLPAYIRSNYLKLFT